MAGERVGFEDANVRTAFFYYAKERSGMKTWGEFNQFFGLEKSGSEYYRNGSRLIPIEKFEPMLACLLPDLQAFYRSNVFYKEKN